MYFEEKNWVVIHFFEPSEHKKVISGKIRFTKMYKSLKKQEKIHFSEILYQTTRIVLLNISIFLRKSHITEDLRLQLSLA